jgi:CHAT domain-containing protein
MRECLYQFEVIRGSVASAGGSFGHKLSYFVSDYLQLTGRDLALLYALDGDMLSALQTAERVRARSLGDWIARSHASNRLEPFNIRDQNATQPFFNSLKVASLNEMADVAASQQANLLIYLNTQIGYLTWLIRPNGTYYAAIVPGGDSLVLASLQALPFGVPINRATRGIAINARSVIKGAAKKSTTDVNAALRTLYQQLLPDSLGVAVADGSAPHLIIVPDGQLNLVPFAALQTPAGSYLLQQASLSYAPSVSSLLLIASSEKVFEADKRYPAGKGPISIWGNPDFKGRYSTTVNGAAETVALSPLPGTAKEVGAIAQLFNASAAQQQAVLTDSVLTRSKVNILHLATHGFANMEDGMQSFVAFSDGPLYAEQLYEQAGVLKAKMVVLSACETGLGYISKDSPIGLTTAFLVGGANSVVSTLWSIDDDASAELMVQFYQQLQQGRDIPAALQAAQLSLLKNPRWASPVFWAAFKQTGSVQNPIR